MVDSKETVSGFAIPQPKLYGPLKNIPLIVKDEPSQSFLRLANELGDIFKFETPAGYNLFISGHDLVEEACDESRFDKFVGPPLRKLRAFGGDGLFTAETRELNWQKAHRLLVPSFSQRAMQGYHHMMTDMASQLVQKWLRLNPEEDIEVAEDMSRLTYDTIGLCGFNYRFNSFYREEMHPFVQSMSRALNEAMNQLWRFGLHQKLVFRKNQQFKADIKSMNQLVDQLIMDRKQLDQTETSPKDLLHFMLNGKDPETGEGLDDENIRHQIITFLIAGHETTSGLLTFALYFLVKHPDVLQKAYEEVDRVMKSSVPTYEEVRSLRYIWMILNEALRLWPTAPSFAVFAKQDTILAGKYPLKKGTGLTILLPRLHRDKRVWGENADKFIPKRFEDMTKVPHHAFKPFGNGQRACIGQLFAMHEATLVLGMILKHFNLEDPYNYQLKIKETLTLKPDHFFMRVRPREQQTASGFVFQTLRDDAIEPAINTEQTKRPRHETPLLVLYGSDLGTAEGIAREVADRGTLQGFAVEVGELNTYIDRLPTKGAVLIVTSSYNGNPPVRAKKFINWLTHLEKDVLDGVNYAVFGCGDRNWQSTYQAIPRLVDERLEACGARRLSVRGEGDASYDFEEQLTQWHQQIWPDLFGKLGIEAAYEETESLSAMGALSLQYVSSPSKPLASVYDAKLARVIKNDELQAAGSPRHTRHIELELPLGMRFEVGDHLGVLPLNDPKLVERVLHRFNIDQDANVILQATGKRMEHFPLGESVRVVDLLTGSVELQEPATRVMLREMFATTFCPPHKKELEALLEEEVYRENVLEKRVSFFELIDTYESCELSFERFLELLPPLKARYYSISNVGAGFQKAKALESQKMTKQLQAVGEVGISKAVMETPIEGAESAERTESVDGNEYFGGTEYIGGQESVMDTLVASITVAVVQEEAWSGRGIYKGVASNFLTTREKGDYLHVFVKRPEPHFTLPQNRETPMIMVGPGTGIAPFRGFLQAREHLVKDGEVLGEAMLFFGCRNEDDFIYRQELEHFESSGLVQLFVGFSRKPGVPKTYVQSLLRQKKEAVLALLNKGGSFYVCGDASAMAPEVEATLLDLYQELEGASRDEALKWLKDMEQAGRYVKDVWAGN